MELLIAFALAIVLLVGATMVSFGGQSAALDAQLSGQAFTRATTHLASTTAKLGTSASVWASLESGQEDESSDPDDNFYDRFRTITDISPCVKFVGSDTNWTSERNRAQGILYGTLVSNIEEVKRLGGGCDPFPPSSDWDTPVSFGGLSASYFDGQGTGVAVSDVSGRRFAYLTTDSANQENFYAIDTSDFDPSDDESVAEEDIYPLKVGNNYGLNGVAVGKIGNNSYAFVLLNNVFGQLQVVNVTNPETPLVIAGASTTLPKFASGIGRSIFYYDEKIYIGTNYGNCASGCADPEQNNELHIYDVSDPSDPQPDGSIWVNRDVNDIYIRDGVAFLATGPGDISPYTPLQIYDINTGSLLGTFPFTNKRAGTAVFPLGNRLYFGLERKNSSDKDFYILDISDNANPTELASVSLEENNTEVGDLLVQGNFAFIGLEGGNSQNNFQVWNILDLDNLWRINPKACNDEFPQNLNGLVYKDNLIFSSFRSQEAFKIIYDTSVICTEY